MLDLVALREMLQEEIEHIEVADDETSRLPLSWVPTAQQLADELTKRTDGQALRKLLDTCILQLTGSEPTEADRSSEETTLLSWWQRWRRG